MIVSRFVSSHAPRARLHVNARTHPLRQTRDKHPPSRGQPMTEPAKHTQPPDRDERERRAAIAMSDQERAAIRQAGADDARRSRTRQGLPERIEDPAAVAVLAAVLRDTSAPQHRTKDPAMKGNRRHRPNEWRRRSQRLGSSTFCI